MARGKCPLWNCCLTVYFSELKTNTGVIDLDVGDRAHIKLWCVTAIWYWKLWHGRNWLSWRMCAIPLLETSAHRMAVRWLTENRHHERNNQRSTPQNNGRPSTLISSCILNSSPWPLCKTILLTSIILVGQKAKVSFVLFNTTDYKVTLALRQHCSQTFLNIFTPCPARPETMSCKNTWVSMFGSTRSKKRA